MSSRTLLTEAEFDALPGREGFKIELNAGELVMTAAARPFHNIIRDRLGNGLWMHAQAHRLGLVLWETEFRLREGVIRIPDVAFLRAERAARLDPHQRPEGASDLAAEVVSPSNDAEDLARKVQQYLRSGAQLVWVVYGEARLVYCYRPHDRPEIREAPQALDAPALLPGWSLPLAELFR